LAKAEETAREIKKEEKATVKHLRRSERTEWALRLSVFGSALVVGLIGAWSIWQSFHDVGAMLIFTLCFALLLAAMIYLIRRRNLGMLETR
jgi:hypothetical protein